MTETEDNSGTASGTPGGEFTMGSIVGKLVLATVRGSDYAHAGEEEAIDLVLGPLAKTPKTRLLDVGCGIGGTARFVEQQGWGTVTGVDIDADNISAAIERHPGIEFICSDAALLDQIVHGQFDIVYSFNAFFLFADQPAALRAMRAVARPSAKLAIFDYVDLGGYAEWHHQRQTSGSRHVLDLGTIKNTLQDAGWWIDHIVPSHAHYLRWYESLIASIESKRDLIVAQSSARFFEFVLATYTQTRDDVRAGRLGGATIYATAN